jgi:hypothetical protein
MRLLTMNPDGVHIDVIHIVPEGEVVLRYPLACVVIPEEKCSLKCVHRNATSNSFLTYLHRPDFALMSYCIHPVHSGNILLLGVHMCTEIP